MLTKPLFSYVVSLLAVAAAIGIRLLLDPLIGTRNPFFTVFLSVVFMAWWGGSGPAWVTSIVGAISASYYILEPRHTFAIDKPEHQIALLLFGIVCFATITLFGTLRKARLRAAENSELLRATLASIGDGVITIDRNSLIISMNAVASSLTGWTVEDAQGQRLESVFHIVNESSRQPVENPALRALKEGVIVGLVNDTLLIAKDGVEWPIDDSAAPIRNKDGEVVGCVVVFREITERRRLERQVSDRATATRLLASIVESSEDAIISKSLEGIIQSWNDSARRLFGYSAEQAVGRHISLLIPADRAEEESHIIAQLRAGKRIEAYDTVRMQSDGGQIHVSLTISPIRNEAGQIIGASKIVRDINERKRVGEALRRSERELSDFFENASVGLHWVGPDGIILRVNQTELDLLGYREDEYVGRHIAEFHVDRPVIDDILARLTRGETVKEYQARLRCKDGSIVDVAINSSVLFEEGQFIHTRCFTRDVSQQKQAELALRNSEQQLATTLESVTDGFIRYDRDWRIVYVNPEAERINQLTRSEMLGKTPWELFPDVVGTKLEEEFRRAMTKRAMAEFENYYKPFGRWYSLKCYPMADGGLTTFIRDITDHKQAEDAIRRAEEQLRTITDTVPALIAYADTDCRYLLNNRAYELWFGHKRSGITGRHMKDVLGDAAWSIVGPKVEEALAGKPVHYVAQVAYEDGGLRWIDATYVPSIGPAGEVEGVVVLVNDISEQKRAEEQLRRSAELLTFVIDRSPSGFYIVDSQFCISHMNADSQARAFRNVNPAIGRRLDDAMRVLWPEPLATEIIAIFRHTLETGEPYRSPGLVSPRADLETVETYEWQLDRIIMPDGTFAVVCYYYDTTQLREAEAEARENAEGLRKLSAELSDADRRKDEFLATLAHELRNPLAPVMNSLAMMKHSISAEQMELARATMERQVGQMVRLIDDLLDVSRITRDKLQLKTERVELTSIVHHAVEACSPLYQRAGHKLTVTLPSEPIYLLADSTRLAQVVGNLLNNSCKYTEPGGQVWLTTERQGNEVVVKVKDNGIGIPTEMLPRVFDLFTQVHGALERSEGGLGIGLSLVKRLVQMHGGSVTANSEGLGRGSEFVVRLPVLIEVQKAPPPRESTSHSIPISTHRMLVVDDNRDSAESLAMLLSMNGAETETAHDGVEAVEKAASFRPEIILLDIGLPKMNGYEACRAIRKLTGGKEMVIVALTGWGQEEDRRKSAEAGFNAHLVKPVELAELQRLLCEFKVI